MAAFILSIFASVLVVTGASEGVGRAYAFEVSKSTPVHVSNILITSVKMVHFPLFLLWDFPILPSIAVLLDSCSWPGEE